MALFWAKTSWGDETSGEPRTDQAQIQLEPSMVTFIGVSYRNMDERLPLKDSCPSQHDDSSQSCDLERTVQPTAAQHCGECSFSVPQLG